MNRRKSSNLFSIFAIIMALSMLVMGCSQGDKAKSQNNVTTQDTSHANTMTLSWNKDIGPLNPHMYAPNEWFAQTMVYESLVQYVEGGKIEPALAESWDISKDGKEYTFHLRQGVKFSDGSDFNANIAKKNLDAILANANKHDWLELINQMKSVEAVDDYTLKISFKNPYYPVLQELALIRPVRFLGEAGFPDSGNNTEEIKKPIGTGPWVLSEYKKDEYATFTRNENYWGEKPKLEKVVVKIIPDGETRVLAFEKGELDLIFGTGLISLDSFKSLKESGKYEAKFSEPLSTRVLAVNSNKGATKDLNVRQALQYGLNKQALIDNLFYGFEKKADTLFAPNFPYSNLGLKPMDYDIEKAKQLLDESGWELSDGKQIREKDGKPLELDFAYVSDDNVQKAVAEAMQGEYSKLGIKVNLVGSEYQSHVEKQKNGEFNLIFSETWGAPYDPHSLVATMRHPSHGDYQAQLGLPMKKEIDQKINEVLISTDEKTRQDLYKYILGTLHEQAVYLPISYISNIAVYQKNVSGVTFTPQQYEVPMQDIEIK